MIETTKVKAYSYSGSLKTVCESFIREKRALGYLYNTEAKKLSEFSRFTLAFDFPENTLTREVVRAWIARKPMDSDKNQYARFSLISQFARYMKRMGYVAYVPDRDEIGKLRGTFAPRILSHEEIRAFFEAADSMFKHSGAPRRHLIILMSVEICRLSLCHAHVKRDSKCQTANLTAHEYMPVLFRMLYCCGLRVSEAVNLKGGDVDLENGILTIRESKAGKARYVPMSAELTEICLRYARTRLVGPPGNDWFFAAPDGGKYHTSGGVEDFREHP